MEEDKHSVRKLISRIALSGGIIGMLTSGYSLYSQNKEHEISNSVYLKTYSQYVLFDSLFVFGALSTRENRRRENYF